MYVEFRGDRVTVRNADDCRSLDVRVAEGSEARLDAALRQAGLGSWDGGAEADLTVDGLRAAASTGGVGADWPARWDAMIDYARTKGWLTAGETHVRAHLVNSSPD